MLSYNRKGIDVLLAKTRSPVIADDNVIYNFKTIIFKHERTRPNCRHSLVTQKWFESYNRFSLQNTKLSYR